MLKTNLFKSKIWVLSGVLPILSTSVSLAAQDEHVQLDAHVHGEAQLMLAVENNQLFVELETPAMNVLGYEHHPETDEQKKTFQRAKGLFKNAENLIKIHGTTCVQQSVEIKTPGMEAEHKDEHDHDEHKHEDDHKKEKHDHDEHEHDEHKKEKHDHDEHEHEDEHKKEKHDHDEHEHDKHEEHDHAHEGEGGKHMEFHLSYTFKCSKADKLTGIELSLFEPFPGFDMIRAQWIFPSGQGAANFDANNRVIKVK